MRTLGALATTTLVLLFLAAAPAYPQDRDQTNPNQQQEEKNKSKDKDKAPKPDRKAKPDEAKPGQDQPAPRPDDRKNDERRVEQPKQNDNRQPETARPQEQRPSAEMSRGNEQRQAQGQRKRIPDDKFRASFGRQHAFHVRREQVVNNPQPVVVYGGYSFQLVEAWPVDWGFDDDVYVDYVDDDYYLFDPLHPGFRIAVIVVE